MRVVINALFSPQGGSLGNLRQLLSEWKQSGVLTNNQFILVCYDAVKDKLNIKNFPELTIETLKPTLSGFGSRIIDEQFSIPKICSQYRADVLFCPSNTGPWFGTTPMILNFQNVAPFCASVTITSCGLGFFIRSKILQLFLRISGARGDKIIVNSQMYRDLLVNKTCISPNKIEVIYRASYPPKPSDQDTKLTLPKEYALYVSHFVGYKNTIELVKAFQLLKERGVEIPLVLVGEQLLGSYKDKVIRLINSDPYLQKNVYLTGMLQPPEVSNVLKNASFFVFPSTCENCPTALIEAITFGKAIACSDVPIMKEVCSDAALYFDPYDPQSIANQVEVLTSNLEIRNDLERMSLTRKDSFDTPPIMATKTFELIEKTVREIKN